MSVKPYYLDQAQTLVRCAVDASQTRHEQWRALQVLYRTGSLKRALSAAKETGTLDLFPKLDQHVVNLVLPHLNIMLASVLVHDPKLLATPYGGGPEAELNQAASEAVMDYFWKRTDATSDLKDATWDLVMLGNGFVKTGWDHREREEELAEDQVVDQLAGLIEADNAMMELGEEPMGDLADLADAVQLTTSVVEVDEPFVEYVSPFDIFVPANARRMWEARWVAQRITLPVDELEANEAFKGEIIPDGRAGTVDKYAAEWRRQAEDDKGIEGRPATYDTATVYEFYDMRSRKLMVFQLNAKKALYEGDLPYMHRYPPFVHLRGYSADGNEFWGFGDLENIAAIQQLFNEFLTEQIANARRSGNKYLVDATVADDDLIDALESDEPDVVAKVELANGASIADVVFAVERKALPNDVYTIKAELEEYLRSVLGVNDFQAGGVGADRMSATAAAVVEGVANLRAMDKIAQVEEAASRIGTQLLLLCQEFLDQPTLIRVAGSDGAAWPEVDRELIRGEYLVTVEGGSTKAVNPATREQRGLRLFAEVLPGLVQLGYDPEPALRASLRDLGFDPDQLLVMAEAPAEEALPEGAGAALPEDAPSSPVVEAGGPPTAVQAQAAGDLAI